MNRQAEQLPHMAAIVSLGCPKNFVDTEIAAGSLLRNGIGITGNWEEADILFINTCAFIDSARQESADMIRKALEWKQADPLRRKIVAAGCLVEWIHAGQVKKQFPEVDLWTRIDSVSEVGNLLSGKKVKLPKGRPAYLYDHRTDRIQLTPAHYAYLKIADGCDNCCAYCSIPLIRGPLRSRTEESVLKEAQDFLNAGVRELIVIAQDTTAFRRDFGEKDSLAHLLKKMDRLKGDFRIRLMYVHPAAVTKELCRVLAGMKHLARCIEMPVQHISDSILLRMGRRAGAAGTREAVRMIREEAHCSIRTTVMTGFPGETEEDFEELLSFIREQRFDRLGAFYYSPETGTRAAKMPDRVPEKTAVARYEKIMRLQKKISAENNRLLLGKTLQVIADTDPFRGTLHARSESDAPEIDYGIRVRNCPKEVRAGDVLNVIIRKTGAYDLTAEYQNSSKKE